MFKARDDEYVAPVIRAPVAAYEPAETESDAPSGTADAETSQAASYQWAVSPEVIGLNPAFVERKLGVAKAKFPSQWYFEVGGCEVNYGITGQEITSLSTNVTAKCNPMVDGVKITPRVKFSSLMSKAKLFSSCIYSCGNAYDPTIDLVQIGDRDNQFIDVQYQGWPSEITGKAMEQWKSAIRSHYGVSDDDYESIEVEWFNCISDAPAEVVSTMRREVVTGIWLGRDLIENCSS
jgi:hypothetical protein